MKIFYIKLKPEKVSTSGSEILTLKGLSKN